MSLLRHTASIDGRTGEHLPDPGGVSKGHAVAARSDVYAPAPLPGLEGLGEEALLVIDTHLDLGPFRLVRGHRHAIILQELKAAFAHPCVTIENIVEGIGPPETKAPPRAPRRSRPVDRPFRERVARGVHPPIRGVDARDLSAAPQGRGPQCTAMPARGACDVRPGARAITRGKENVDETLPRHPGTRNCVGSADGRGSSRIGSPDAESDWRFRARRTRRRTRDPE